MKLITTSNYDCVLASFAMVMGWSTDHLRECLGHDGKAIVAADVPAPECYRSFHPEELVDLLLEHGYSTTMFSMFPMMKHGPQLVNHAAFMGRDRFFKPMLKGDGVIFCKLKSSQIGHAVAWNHRNISIYDPRGVTYEWTDRDASDLEPLHFYLIQEIKP